MSASPIDPEGQLEGQPEKEKEHDWNYVKTKNLLLSTIFLNIFLKVLTSLFAVDYLRTLLSIGLDFLADPDDLDTYMIIMFLVTVAFDVLGLVGAFLENFNLVFLFSLVAAMQMTWCMVHIFKGQALILFVMLMDLTLAAFGFSFAKLLCDFD